MEREEETAPKPSNSTGLNDLGWPLTQISRSWYHSASNNSKTLPDRAIFTMADQYKVVWSIKWRHFQWPWTTLNPIFKVTLFFDAEYLINGWRYGHSYYGRQVGNRTQAFEWYQFEWPSVTFFKMSQRQKTWKWYNIQLSLQWPTNKSHMVYRAAPFSMTLNDSCPQFWGHAVFLTLNISETVRHTDIVSY